MEVLVTGASGFLATNTIIKLLKGNYIVRALTHHQKKVLVSTSEKLKIIECDYKNITDIERAVLGCDFIIHTAAETRQGLISYKDYESINIKFTKTLCEIALKCHIKKIIFISTANVFGYGNLLNPGDENQLIKKPFSNSYYVRSKLEAQKIVLSFKDKIEPVIINPTFMIGPYDNKKGSVRLLRNVFNKRILFFPPGGKNFVSVDDVAEIIILALNHSLSGEILIVANENLSYKAFFLKASKISKTKPILIPIPSFLLMILGLFGELLKMGGVRNDFTFNNMRIICVKNFYSNKKVIEKFQFTFNSLDKILFDAYEWMSEKQQKQDNKENQAFILNHKTKHIK